MVIGEVTGSGSSKKDYRTTVLTGVESYVPCVVEL